MQRIVSGRRRAETKSRLKIFDNFFAESRSDQRVFRIYSARQPKAFFWSRPKSNNIVEGIFPAKIWESRKTQLKSIFTHFKDGTHSEIDHKDGHLFFCVATTQKGKLISPQKVFENFPFSRQSLPKLEFSKQAKIQVIIPTQVFH